MSECVSLRPRFNPRQLLKDHAMAIVCRHGAVIHWQNLYPSLGISGLDLGEQAMRFTPEAGGNIQVSIDKQECP